MIIIGNKHMKIIERFGLTLYEIHDLNPDALEEYILDNLMPLIGCNDNDEEHSADDILTLITEGDRNVPIIFTDKCVEIEEFRVTKYFMPTEIPILFFAISETGAMGTPGELTAITVADDKSLIFTGNYLYGDIDEADVIKIYPPIGEYFNKGVLLPDVVHYDCGCGNHLFVGQAQKDDFEKAVDGKITGAFEVPYMDAALTSLGYTKQEIERYYSRRI